MTRDEAVEKIQAAFRGALPSRDAILSAEECRALSGELLTMMPDDRRQLLPQILLEFLRSPKWPGYASDLHQLLSDLNIGRGPDPAYYEEAGKRWGRQEAESQHRLHERLLARYQEDHRVFTAQEATAVVAFLEAVRGRVSHKIAMRDWNGAHEFWTNKSLERESG